MTRILHIDASSRTEGSLSRALSADVLGRLAPAGTEIIRRDLTTPLPFINHDWVGATFTPESDRSAQQHETLALSDTLVEELEAADLIIIGTPIYNFGVPAALKAWIDLVARAGRTFRYTEAGPEGLLRGKRAVIAVASGGTPIGSEIDFATTHLRQVLGFLGITQISVVTGETINDELPKQHAA